MSNDEPADWVDVVLHVILAFVAYAIIIVITLLLGFPFYPWIMAGINGMVWLGREIMQHWPHPQEVVMHKQSLLEWTAPVLFGILVAVTWSMLL